MSQYPYPKHCCRTLRDLEFYPFSKKKRIEDYKYRVEGRGWVLGIF